MVFEHRRGIGKLGKISRRSVGAAFQAKRARNRAISDFFLKVFTVLFLGGCVCSMVIGFYVYKIFQGLPEIDKISVYVPDETTKIYTADGVVLAELHKEENRILVPLSDISASIQKAVVSVEDNRFYKHHGIDFRAILRAAQRDVVSASKKEGASTITQQLARNLFLTKERSYTRKVAEVLLALQIERHYTKEEILEMYLNQVYWGHNAYGIESSSQLYFGKHAKELTLGESAMLVGLLRGPELYSPYTDMQKAVERQKVVLDVMKGDKTIDSAQYIEAISQPIVLIGRKKTKYKAPYFTSYVVEQLINLYGEDSVYNSGMKVFTTIDYKLQQYAEAAVQKGLELGQKEFYTENGKVPSANFSEAAIISINPRNGYILALVGGSNYQGNEFNKVLQAYRQPGSAFKPFCYLTALTKGLSPGTVINDAPIVFNTVEGPYAPKNYTKRFEGPLPMRRALELSINVVAIRIVNMVGPENVVAVAKKLGITSDLKPVLSLPLGACEVTMLDLVYAYGVFANSGIKARPLSILRIEDRNGVEIYRNHIVTEKVYDDNLINTLVDMMKGIILYGTGRGAALPRPMAGKTGTTSDYRDAWFLGFVPQMVTATWVGNDDNSPMNGVTGGTIPAMMWKEYMKNALDGVPVIDFPKTRGLVPVKICWDSGLKAGDYCPEDRVTYEKFWRERAPVDVCNIHTSEGKITTPVQTSSNNNLMDEFFGEEGAQPAQQQQSQSKDESKSPFDAR